MAEGDGRDGEAERPRGAAWARRTDPETSREAAEAASYAAPGMESDILAELGRRGAWGGTSKELADALGLPSDGHVTPRLKPLEAKGLVRRSGTKSVNPSGKRAEVWIAAAAGRCDRSGQPPPARRTRRVLWVDEYPDGAVLCGPAGGDMRRPGPLAASVLAAALDPAGERVPFQVHVDGGIYRAYEARIRHSERAEEVLVVYEHVFPFEPSSWGRPAPLFGPPRFSPMKPDAAAAALAAPRAEAQEGVRRRKAARRQRSG
jgi:hypothetical protein